MPRPSRSSYAAPPSAPAAVNGDGLALESALTYQLHLLHKLADRDGNAAYLAETGLPISEARCLGAIGAFAPLSINDLAQRANLDKAQASRAAQALVDQGLVRKQPSANDGRGVTLSLSRQGEARYARVLRVIEQRNEEVFGCLSAAERATLARLFERLIAHARARSGTRSDNE